MTPKMSRLLSWARRAKASSAAGSQSQLGTGTGGSTMAGVAAARCWGGEGVGLLPPKGAGEAETKQLAKATQSAQETRRALGEGSAE